MGNSTGSMFYLFVIVIVLYSGGRAAKLRELGPDSGLL